MAELPARRPVPRHASQAGSSEQQAFQSWAPDVPVLRQAQSAGIPGSEKRQRRRHDATLLTQALHWVLGAILSVGLCVVQASQATSAVPADQAASVDQAASAAPDPALEKRVEALAQELRCLVCQNQTIADSQAPLAVELKNQVREQLARGRSSQDVIDFMVQRYGDFVLYRPPVKASTWLLWFGPFLLLALGLLALALKLRQKPAPLESPSAAEQAELAQAAALLTGQTAPVAAVPTATTAPTAPTPPSPTASSA